MPSSGAKVPGRVKGISLTVEDEDAVLEETDKVLAELEAQLALADDGTFQEESSFP